jgi:alkylation response protein AidB-like acyl-CoA dehydrogenase
MTNDYSFHPFIEERENLTEFENPYIKNLLQFYGQDESDSFLSDMEEFSKKITRRWKPWIENLARKESRPALVHYDAFNNRIDEIRRPMEMHRLEHEVFSEALFSDKTSNWERTAKRFLLHHQGETGIMCPIACTDGLVAVMEQFEDKLQPELTAILNHLKESRESSYGIGAQYMSEIQGGSNIPANQLLAVKDGQNYKLYGNKFFCSAAHADYSVVTALVEGTKNVAMFIVPTWSDEEKKIRNNYRINRLKDKLGTTELPTAEIDYDGATAYQLGEVDKGIGLAVGTVLTRSRLDIGFSSAAFMMRAAREATMYAHFRDVFDRKIAEFPLAFAQLQELDEAAKRSTATAFEIYDRFIRADQLGNTPADIQEQYLVRELILLQKIFSANEAVDMLRQAISIFGGHGVMEDFSSLPRLLRDAMVNELWEGPKNVLLTQIYRDLQKMKEWYPVKKFITDLLPNSEQNRIDKYTLELQNLLETPLNGEINDYNITHAKQWEIFCQSIFYDYQVQVMKKVDDLPILENYTLKLKSAIK